MFDDLNWDFVTNLFRNGSTDLFGDFTRHVDGVFDTNCFGKVFASFSWYENGKILAFFLGNFFTFGTWDLFFDFDWNLK